MASESEEPPRYPYAEMDRNEAEAKLNHEVVRFFQDYQRYQDVISKAQFENPYFILNLVIGVNTPPFRRQIIAPAGMGKTRAVARALKQLKNNESVWFMVPRLSLAEEVAETIRKESGLEVAVVKGRSEEMCKRHNVARALGSKGIPVQSTICDNKDSKCFYFEECPYQEQRAKLTEHKEEKEGEEQSAARVYVMAHAYMTSKSIAPDPDLVIIDESHWQSFIDITGQKHTQPNLTFSDLQNAVNTSIEDHESYSEVIERIIRAMEILPIAFLNKLRNMFHIGSCPSETKQARPQPLQPIDFEHFERAIEYIKDAISQSEKPNITPDWQDKHISENIKNLQTPKLKAIAKLLRILQFELKQKKLQSAIICNNDKSITIHNLKQNLIYKKTPVLLIDASASYAINSKIWGRNLQTVEIKAERNATVIQVKKHTFSKYALGIPYANNGEWQPDEKQLILRKQVIDFINERAEETNGNIFLAASKRIEDELKPHLATNVLTSHFGALRGSNMYENCETAIILGREQPPIESIENIARALLSRSDERLLPNSKYIDRRLGRRLADGTTEIERVSEHFDKFPQEVLRQIREHEIEQAIDRLRLIHNTEPKTVYLLCSVVLDITVDHSVTWEQLNHFTLMDQAIHNTLKNEGKAFPLGATDLAKSFPDLWSTPDKVKGYVKRRGGFKWVVSLIRYYIPNDPLYLVEYRRVGQRGKPSRAIVFGPAENAATTLNTAFGDISKFKIIKQMNEGNSFDD